jgi:hypothetical protein
VPSTEVCRPRKSPATNATRLLDWTENFVSVVENVDLDEAEEELAEHG